MRRALTRRLAAGRTARGEKSEMVYGPSGLADGIAGEAAAVSGR
jgi:hypothetical protein